MNVNYRCKLVIPIRLTRFVVASLLFHCKSPPLKFLEAFQLCTGIRSNAMKRQLNIRFSLHHAFSCRLSQSCTSFSSVSVVLIDPHIAKVWCISFCFIFSVYLFFRRLGIRFGRKPVLNLPHTCTCTSHHNFWKPLHIVIFEEGHKAISALLPYLAG